MGVNGDAFIDVVGVSQDDVRRLATHTRQLPELLHGSGDLSTVIGNQRLESFPIWEFGFGNLPEGSQAIATSKMKWDSKYREKLGITSGAAKDLPQGFESLMSKLCKRIYSILGLCGYARLDFRLTADGKIYLIEPNPNPDLGRGEDFSESALAVGVNYEDLIQRVLTLGLKYQTAR
jgi:D-alanine-D-alanine ligase